MFEYMKSLKLLFFVLLVSLSPLMAQEKHCATQLSDSQISQLKKIQSQLDGLKGVYKKAGVRYVPIQVHILGNNQGIGYYRVESLLQALCDVNQDFAPTGFRFYMNGPINYINNDELYRGSSDAIWFTAEDYKAPNAVNVFFHGTGNQWCGVYFPGVDVVFVLNRCQGTNATTLTHELGHFFGLPHTFYGWEGGSRPSEADVEKLDGSNCRTAGDGFCDTKADYVADRWGCPLPYQLQDPNGLFFKPDSSIYMSYSSDVCQSRFSEEQQLAMQSDLDLRNIASNSANTDTLQPPSMIFPMASDSNLNPKSIELKWNKVEGAFAYHVQVARFAAWEFLNFEVLTQDTQTLVTTLYGTWPYSWRVKAITRANTCGKFSEEVSFSTKEVLSGIQDIRFENGFKFYPNPVEINRDVQLVSKSNGYLKIFDINGKILHESITNAFEEHIFQIRKSGVFILQFTNESGTYTGKIVCEE